MSVASSYGLTVKSALFEVLAVEYPAGSQNNLLLGSPVSPVVRNDCAYLYTTFPAETISGVTGYNSFAVISDGIYLMSLQLNNDYIGTPATVCSCDVFLYYFVNGTWKIAYANERTYPQADTTNSLSASIIIDTTVLKSKIFCWNIQPYTEPFTPTISTTFNYQFAQVTMLSPL